MVFHVTGQGRLFSIPSNPDLQHLHQQQQHHFDHQHHCDSKEIERIIWWTGLTASWSADLTFVFANRLLMLHSLLFVTWDLRFYPSDEDRDDDDGDEDLMMVIYILQWSVCLSVCHKNDHFPLPSWAPEARSELPARPGQPKAGFGLVMMMMMMMTIVRDVEQAWQFQWLAAREATLVEECFW